MSAFNANAMQRQWPTNQWVNDQLDSIASAVCHIAVDSALTPLKRQNWLGKQDSISLNQMSRTLKLTGIPKTRHRPIGIGTTLAHPYSAKTVIDRRKTLNHVA